MTPRLAVTLGLAATLARATTDGFDPNDVSPGVLGFLVIFVAALACIPLFRSMTTKLRKVDRRALLEDEAAPAADAGTPAPAPEADDHGQAASAGATGPDRGPEG